MAMSIHPKNSRISRVFWMELFSQWC